MADSSPLRLTALEIASTVVVGLRRAAPSPATSGTPLAALERAVLPALQRSPCLVSFSGGVDSSFVLGVAVRVARREGLPAPVPVTWRFTGAPKAEESGWQERVVEGLGIADWQRLQADDDLDLIGPVAQRVLTRHGVVHPLNSHLHLPLIELAAGGSFLTGVGGDQMLLGWRRPGRRSASRVLRSHVAGRLVTRVHQQRGQDAFPWLRPAASREVSRRLRAERRREPQQIDRRIAWHARRRDLVMSCASLDAIASDHDVLLTNPLLDPSFLRALGRDFASARGLTRADLLQAITADQLPEVAIAPRPKAHFLEVFLRSPTRDFVRDWDGSGVDETLVNPNVLREMWSKWPIDPGTVGLVQQLWLSATTRPVRPASGKA